MGSGWRMPTNEETRELIYNTTHTFIDLHGNEYSEEQAQNGAILENNLKGIKFIGFNGNSIFIPAAAICHGLMLNSVGHYGTLWSSSLLEYSDFGTTLYFYYNGHVADGNDQRYLGLSVRGVLKQ
jgi:hypothetical protein